MSAPDPVAAPLRLLHTMLRVRDLDTSLGFYLRLMGMSLLRREHYPDGRFTLAFVGYGDERAQAVLELTHNWDRDVYERGDAYGHVALAVADVRLTCAQLAAAGVKIVRKPGPMQHIADDRSAPQNIAFVEDPDGYRIELVEVAQALGAA